jgi:parallel beta-helix repeat protein
MLKLVTRNICSLLFFFLLINVQVMGQANSVELRDGTGALVSAYSSIAQAYAAIPATITQAYVVEILSTYDGSAETYPITLLPRDGASATNSITIRPATSVSMATVGGTAGGQPIFLFSDADYVTLDGRAGGTGESINLTVQNLATTSQSHTLRFLDGATYNTVKYLKIINSTQATAGPRAIEIGTSASNPTGNSNNYIAYNEIIGGRSGIGLAGTSANPNNENVIYKNKIYDWAYAGIWVLSSSNNTVISNNEFWQTAGYSTTPTGVIFGAVINLDIIGNKIYDIQQTGTSTIRGISGNMAAGAVLNIINNFVSLMLDNGTKTSIYAIQVSGTNAYTANIYYNSIRLGGIHTGGSANTVVSAGIVKSSTSADAVFNMKNNIVLNTRTGGTDVFHTGFFGGSTNMVGTLDIDYNVYYGADATSNHAGWAGFLYSDITAYKAAATPHEQNTIFKPTNFVSGIDLHLTGASVTDPDLTALPIAGITTDIDGQPRSATAPYRGADEADDPIPVELTAFSASVTNNNVTLQWSTATETNNLGFDIERKSTEGAWIKAGFIEGSSTTTELRSYTFIDKNLPVGIYNYRLKQIDFDGSFAYYMLNETVDVIAPAQFDLSQNYPNPFNPATVINYQLAENSFVTLKIYDVLGNEVVTLVNEAQPAGVFTIQFDGSTLASGMYIYKLMTENFTASKKMMLLK